MACSNNIPKKRPDVRMFFRYLLLITIVVYCASFSIIDRSFQNNNVQLQSALPAPFQKIASGYLSQLFSEILFIKTAVFLGGLKPGVAETSYEGTLTNNFTVMTSLNPHFLDPYYFCQSFLAHISTQATTASNDILQTGIDTHQNNFTLRFFQGFNYFRYLNDPINAAITFQKAADLPDAPPTFGHLSALFSAKGGNIETGLIMLKTMLTVEQNEGVQKAYKHEIKIFEQALEVKKAVTLFTNQYHTPPQALENLIPEFLNELPTFSKNFVLVYEPSTLRLRLERQ